MADKHTPRPSPPGAALDLLERSLDAGATPIAIGPYTNLALLEITRAGSLNQQPVVVMGGWVQPPAPGHRSGDRTWTSNMYAGRAAEVAAATAQLTLVTPRQPSALTFAALTCPAFRLQDGWDSCSLGRAKRMAANQTEKLGREHSGLPDDLLNFHYDPIARRGGRLVWGNGRERDCNQCEGRRTVLPAES